MKRIAIYFFYDKNGIVDRSNTILLDDLSKNIDEILIVSNGNLSNQSKKALSKYGQILERENKGFDVWAYKEGIEKIGWNCLKDYDELILLNSTIYGPIYPFSETFKKMDSRTDLDFWGITEYFKFDGDPFNCISLGYIPDHIQSHFIAIRKNLYSSEEFINYWKNMPEINSYSEAIGKHEAIFTKTFSDLGYKWATSVDMEDLRGYSGYPLMMCPKLLVEKYRCPIIKRRSFFHDIDDFLNNTGGEQSYELFEYIKDKTNFDTDIILENLLRNYNQYDIQKHLNFTYILSTKNIQQKTNSKVAGIYHVYFEDLIPQTKNYLSSLSTEYDIYITTDTIEKKQAIEKAFSDTSFKKFEVRVIENRGRDVSSLLVGVKDIIMNYDIVCFGHDKKTAQVSPETIGDSFAYKCQRNILHNSAYTENIIATFENNPRLGILSPPEPNHSIFNATIGLEWGPNFKNTEKLAKKLGITVSLDAEKPPVAPLGTMFWFRPKAFELLYKYDWNYSDFPPEPNKVDGSLLHAIERLYPFAVQQLGYYPGIVMTDYYAGIEYGNLRHYVRDFNVSAMKHGYAPTHTEMIKGVEQSFTELEHYKSLFNRKFFKVLLVPYKIVRAIYRFPINLYRVLKFKSTSGEIDEK